MSKAIFANDVKTGDRLLLSGGERSTVVSGVECYNRVVRLQTESGERILNELDIVGLVSRSGTREERDAAYSKVAELLQQTTWKTSPFGGVVNTGKFQELLWALQEYELLKPVESVPHGVSSDPVEAAIDASCGYLGGGWVVW